MILAQILHNNFRSVSVMGMGKNTGKTFTVNHLLMEGKQLGINSAITTIGLDGEERGSLSHHPKPQIMVSPGQIVANAKALLIESGLDYEILGMTGIMTPLGEIILARAQSGGKTMLAGPGTRHELAFVKGQLEQMGIDLLLVDGAVDRRSLSAPLVTDTTVLTVGTEVAWDRSTLMEKFGLHYQVLTLPAFAHPSIAPYLRGTPEDVKAVILSAQGLQGLVTHGDFFQNPDILSEYINQATQTVYVRGMLTADVLDKVLANATQATSLTILVADPTSVFLGKQSFQRLSSQNVILKVLDPIHISAVTVNPFNSTYGYADPIQLLKDLGQAVYPVPCFDLSLGIRYVQEEEDVNAIS